MAFVCIPAPSSMRLRLATDMPSLPAWFRSSSISSTVIGVWRAEDSIIAAQAGPQSAGAA
jgi:hypothetical protein